MRPIDQILRYSPVQTWQRNFQFDLNTKTRWDRPNANSPVHCNVGGNGDLVTGTDELHRTNEAG